MGVQDPRFLVGLAVAVFGAAVNIHSDGILLSLRKPGETGYKIPEGGMFRFVSGANFLGEIMEGSGWALASWNLSAACFAFCTACNLAPRAVSHHRWYLEKFDDYAKLGRKALIPALF